MYIKKDKKNYSYLPEYQTWRDIKKRCFNSKCNVFKHYGGRGITIDTEWLDFENFYKDMGKRPSNKYSIERIDNNKSYSKSNCKWATKKEQCSNTRQNNYFTINGVTKTLTEWCNIFNIKRNTVYYRINIMKYNIERALTEPLKIKG